MRAHVAEEGRTGGILSPRTLGEALKLLQHRAGVNRDDLARESRVSTGALSNYLNDASVPSAATLRRITTALARRLDEAPDRVWAELGGLLDRGAFLVTTRVVPELAAHLGEDGGRAWTEVGHLLDHSLHALDDWSQSVEQSLPLAEYRTDLYWLLRFTISTRVPLERAAPEDVARFLSTVDNRGEAGPTARGALSRFYRWLRDTGRRSDDPTATAEPSEPNRVGPPAE